MMIYIDKTIGEHFLNTGFNDDELLLFSDLASSHKKGDCVLTGDLETIETLMEVLGGFNGSIYRKIRNHHTEIRTLAEKIELVLVLSYNEIPVVPNFIIEKAIVIKIPDAINYRLSEQCTLLAENLNDCKFYRLLAEKYMCTQNIKGAQISFRYEPGGGNTINKVFEKCVTQDKNLILCIVDSDIRYWKTKNYPQEPAKGDTAKLLIRTYDNIAKSLSPVLYELYCLPVHEVENLIPLSVLEIVCNKSYPCMNEGIKFLQKLINCDCGQAVLFYDFKFGKEKFLDAPCLEYWNEISAEISDDSFPKLGEKILEKTIVVLQDECLSLTLDTYLVQIWLTIGRKVFSWGCANKPIRT